MVTISRQTGSGGDRIAQVLAEELGWSSLNKEVLERLLVERGFPKREVEIYEEEKMPGLWHRFSAERDRYLHYLKLVSYEFARQGSCIVVGRGGQVLFRNVPGAVHVRVVSPLQDRVKKVSEQLGYDENEARQAVQHQDSDRAGFHRFLFQTNWDALDLYDLIVNTHLISDSTAVDLIKRALESDEVAAQKEGMSRKLEDLYLAQKAIIDILYEQQLPVHFLEIEVEEGVMRLKGTTGDQEAVERCREAAAGMPGVTEVNNEISFVPGYVAQFLLYEK